VLLPALLDLSPWADAAVVAMFVLGGIVKGVIGVGLPLLLVPLTSPFLGVPVAVALVSVPMVIANIDQCLEGGGTVAVVRGLWPIMLPLVAGGIAGVQLLINVDRHTLYLMLGMVFLVVAVLLIVAPRIRISRRAERWAGPLVGLVAGVIGGVSGAFGPPLIAFQIGLGIQPQLFVKRMAILALTASTTLLLSLGGSGALSWTDLLVSAAMIIPIQLGMPIGRRLRGLVPAAVFRNLVLVTLAGAGVDMLRRALG
jgi:uncharacterized membrane protein YfcA